MQLQMHLPHVLVIVFPSSVPSVKLQIRLKPQAM